MKTTSVTRIELDFDEEQILRKALEILKEVNDIIDNRDISYVVDNADMNLYNSLWDEINNIEDWVTRG